MKNTILKSILIKIFGLNFLKTVRSRFKSRQEKDDELIRRKFYSQFLTRGDIFFDVGANYGNRIEPVIQMGLKIIAVEPQIECVQYLKRKYGNKVIVVNKGLSSKIEDKTMFVSDAHVISSFSEDFINLTKASGRFKSHTWKKGSVISMTTLDNLINEHGIPSFIKIDVEGFELEVLKGLSHKVEYISYEYTVPEQSNKALECLLRIAQISEENISCNYSIGESMEWALPNWVSLNEFLKIINSKEFIQTKFGDIYVKSDRLSSVTNSPSAEEKLVLNNI